MRSSAVELARMLAAVASQGGNPLVRGATGRKSGFVEAVEHCDQLRMCLFQTGTHLPKCLFADGRHCWGVEGVDVVLLIGRALDEQGNAAYSLGFPGRDVLHNLTHAPAAFVPIATCHRHVGRNQDSVVGLRERTQQLLLRRLHLPIAVYTVSAIQGSTMGTHLLVQKKMSSY